MGWPVIPGSRRSAPAEKPKPTYPTLDAAIEAMAHIGKFVWKRAYPGPHNFHVARFDLPTTDPETGKHRKEFRPFHETPDGWVCADPPGLLPLYGVDDLPADGPIIVTEGELKVDAARSVGLAAVTSSHGCKSADRSDWTLLRGRKIIILADNDSGGLKYAYEVAAILVALGCEVRIIVLPGLPPKGDIVDWLNPDGPMGDKSKEECHAAIMALAEQETPWTPTATATAVEPAAATTPIEPYRPFPVDSLPEPMRSFVAQAAESVGCDAAFVALPLLAASASAIGNTRRIELKPGWTEPAILWASLVGDSGTRKSPAQELALRPLRRRQQDAMKQYTLEMDGHKVKALRYEIDLAGWKKSGGEGPPPAEPQEPILPRCWCDDTTIEALAVLLLQNWRGLLMVRDELAGWLGGFDRYAQGKGGDAAKWLEMHGGRSITVDRKTGNPRTIHVPCAAVSLVGGIQPATLQRALGREYFENGLAARLLLAYPPRRVKRWTEAQIDLATEEAVASMIDRLYTLEPVAGQSGDPEPGIVRLSADAKGAWVRFYNEHAEEHVGLTGDLAAAWSKLEGYAARLALVVHFVRWAAGDPTLASVNVVDEASIAAGVTLSRWFGQETRRVYAILDETEIDRERRGLVELVRRHGGSITVRDLMRSSRAHSTSDTAEQALHGLVQAHLGRWEDVTPTAQGGRPTRRFVLADTVDVDTTPENLR